MCAHVNKAHAWDISGVIFVRVVLEKKKKKKNLPEKYESY